MEITLDDLKRRLPDPDDFKATDEYYLTLAKYIGKLWESMDVFPEIGEEMRKNVVVNLVSYYQDVIADAGLWRPDGLTTPPEPEARSLQGGFTLSRRV